MEQWGICAQSSSDGRRMQGDRRFPRIHPVINEKKTHIFRRGTTDVKS